MTATPTGRLDRSSGEDALVFTRTFSAPIEDVWAAVTESDRMARWIGTWTGDPADGQVIFSMNAEGDGAPQSPYDIDECDPPRLLRVTSIDDSGTWRLALVLTHSAGITTLTMSQVIEDSATIESTGPGWDYYLDRLVAAESGTDVAAIDFDADYYPAQRDHYRAIRDQISR